ncbi:MAG: phage tail protein [bacterium]|nr:phage tail protein [bacterium]
MSEPFIAEIRIFAGNFAPRSWAFCDGQLLPVAQNTALFSLVGTTYGGDGRTNFGLPDLAGRVPVHAGNGPGLTPRQLGESGGTETVTLTEAQIPTHSHQLQGVNNAGVVKTPSTEVAIARSTGTAGYQTDSSSNLVAMAADTIDDAGGTQPHDNMQPYLALSYIIALTGLFPSQD